METPTLQPEPASEITDKAVVQQPAQRRRWLYDVVSWSGLLPFFLFCLLFEILPALVLLQGSFIDQDGNATLSNYQRLFTQSGTLHAFENSIELSLLTALISTIIGFFAAYAVFNLRATWLRNLITGFSSLTANFAGVPLAFAFISTLGVTGFVTVLIHNWLHVNLYDLGFSLYNFWGLVLTYSYFELPLMVLVTVPSLSALRPEWREAATNLGASTLTYWRKVALPVLFPSLIASLMLLFANAFSAYATAYALAQGGINLVTILISFAIAGNVSIDIGLGNALAMGMVLVLCLAVALYTYMLRRASLWQGR